MEESADTEGLCAELRAERFVLRHSNEAQSYNWYHTFPQCLCWPSGLLFYQDLEKFLEKSGLVKQPFTRQENTVIQTCVVASSGIAFSGILSVLFTAINFHFISLNYFEIQFSFSFLSKLRRYLGFFDQDINISVHLVLFLFLKVANLQ
jgi:hypothetical protein